MAPFLWFSFILHSSELDFTSTFFIWNGLDLTSTFFIRNGLDLTSTFFIRMGLTLLSHCSFQIGLASDFSFLFQAQETQGCTRCTQLGSILRRTTSYLILFSFPSLSIKQNRLAVTERNLMEFVKPAVSCPIECNRLLVCVRISCGFRRADCPRALATGLPARLMRAFLPRAPASGSLLPRAPAAPTSRCRSDGPWDCGVQRQQWSWWPATVACAVQHSLTVTVTCTHSRDDSDGRFLTVLSIYVGSGQQTIPRRNLNKQWVGKLV